MAVDESTAKSYIMERHYSRSYPASKWRFGMFDSERLCGVLVFGVPTSKRVLTIPFPSLTPYAESIELSRLVVDDMVPKNGESWFIARCLEKVRQLGARGVVAFADPTPRVINGVLMHRGHVGTIYQATNATCLGRSTPRLLTVLPDGTVLNDRSAQKIRSASSGHSSVQRRLVSLGASPPEDGEGASEWLARALNDVGAIRARHRGNWRYAFRLGNRAERRNIKFGLDPCPYPKCTDSAGLAEARIR
jgi:hypothetical protein